MKIIEIISIVIFAFVIVIGLIHALKRLFTYKSFKEFWQDINEHKSQYLNFFKNPNWLFALLIGLGFYCLVLCVFQDSFEHNKQVFQLSVKDSTQLTIKNLPVEIVQKESNEKQFDWVLLLGLLIGIIAAIWAIAARIDAGKAFVQSEKTYKAFGSTFDFASFFDIDDKYPKLLKTINELTAKNEECNICLCLGFPGVGILSNIKQNVKIGDLITHLKTLNSILERYNDGLKSLDAQPKYKLRISCFAEEISIGLIDGLKDGITEKEKETVKEKITNFYIYYNAIKKCKREFVDDLNIEEKFRFITLDNIRIREKISYLWVVNIRMNDIGGKIVSEPFDSVVFRSYEEKFVSLLEGIIGSAH